MELRNLHRQILHSTDDLDYPKVKASAKRLGKVNPLVETEPIPENVNAGNVEEILSGMDCVVDGLDNMHTRYLLNRACAKLRIPYVLGAAIGIEENLSVFAPPETLCLRAHIYEDAYIKSWICKKGYKVLGVYDPYCLRFRSNTVWMSGRISAS